MGIYITHFESNLHISNLQQESLGNTFPTLLATSVFTEHISSLTYNTCHYRTYFQLNLQQKSLQKTIPT